MATLAFLSFFDEAQGESVQKGKEKWVELRGWSWGVDADTSWTRGSGASVGRPNPGRLTWEHDFDTASPAILARLCNGTAFAKAELQMLKIAGSAAPVTYLTISLDGVFITRAGHVGTADGSVLQQVEMVFKSVRVEYRPQDRRTGKLGTAKVYAWDVTTGAVAP
jgi:type VI secretion system Hcp family effector